jgi:hypothetical protein
MKKIGAKSLTEKMAEKWVETKRCGLKIDKILACWGY